MTADDQMRVKVFVADGVSPEAIAFECCGWDANQLLLAWANLYRDESGAIDAGGREWEGVWCSPDNLAFIDSLIR